MYILILEYIRLQEKTSIWRTREGQDLKKFEDLHRHLEGSTESLVAVFSDAFAMLQETSEHSSELEKDRNESRNEPLATTFSATSKTLAVLISGSSKSKSNVRGSELARAPFPPCMCSEKKPAHPTLHASHDLQKAAKDVSRRWTTFKRIEH
jgi:hypothetical protein